MNFTLADLLERLAGRAINGILQDLAPRLCPKDGTPMQKLPSGDFYCMGCDIRWVTEEAPQRPRSPFAQGLGNTDAFRPFDPLGSRNRARRGRTYDGYEPPQAKSRPKRAKARPAPPPPPRLPRNEVAAALKLLGLPPEADKAAVKARRRELAMKHHPDRGGDGKKLARVNAAADLLLEML